MDWNARGRELADAASKAFDELNSALAGEKLYAICLQTADDGMSVGFCANTEEGYAEKRASEAEFEEMTSGYEAYLRWAPAEWRYEMFGDAHFMDVNRDLSAAALNPKETFDVHFERLIEVMIEALAKLRAERGAALGGITLFVTISDSEDAEAVERRSAMRLNTPEQASAFVERFG